MDHTITITGGSGTDSITVSDTMILDLGDYGAAQPALTSTSLPAINLDDLISTSVTLPTSTYSIGNGGTGGTGSYSYGGGGGGGAGTVWTTTGTNYTWGHTQNTVTIDNQGLSMEKGTDIKIGGKSLSEAIEKIEERLGILNPNSELEERWDKLKELRKQYMEMEKDLLEKEKIMKILKET